MIERVNKYTCDRCGTEVATRPVRVQIQMYGKLSSGWNGYRTEDKFDLCPECMKTVIKLLYNKQSCESEVEQ